MCMLVGGVKTTPGRVWWPTTVSGYGIVKNVWNVFVLYRGILCVSWFRRFFFLHFCTAVLYRGILCVCANILLASTHKTHRIRTIYRNGDKKSSRNSLTHKIHRYRTNTSQTFLTIPYPNTVVGHRTRPRCSFYPPHQHTHLFARYRTVNCFCTTNIHIKYRVAGQ